MLIRLSFRCQLQAKPCRNCGYCLLKRKVNNVILGPFCKGGFFRFTVKSIVRRRFHEALALADADMGLVALKVARQVPKTRRSSSAPKRDFWQMERQLGRRFLAVRVAGEAPNGRRDRELGKLTAKLPLVAAIARRRASNALNGAPSAKNRALDQPLADGFVRHWPQLMPTWDLTPVSSGSCFAKPLEAVPIMHFESPFYA